MPSYCWAYTMMLVDVGVLVLESALKLCRDATQPTLDLLVEVPSRSSAKAWSSTDRAGNQMTCISVARWTSISESGDERYLEYDSPSSPLACWVISCSLFQSMSSISTSHDNFPTRLSRYYSIISQFKAIRGTAQLIEGTFLEDLKAIPHMSFSRECN